MITPRHKLAAVLLADGRVLVAGGSDNHDWRGKYASAEIYDPATGRFSKTTDRHSERFQLTDGVVRLRDGHVLIAGGAENLRCMTQPAMHSNGSLEPVGNGRYFSSATLLSDGQVLITGGYGEDPGAGGGERLDFFT